MKKLLMLSLICIASIACAGERVVDPATGQTKRVYGANQPTKVISMPGRTIDHAGRRVTRAAGGLTKTVTAPARQMTRQLKPGG